MIDWLNNNSGAILALLTLVYVIATIVLVCITSKSTRVAQKSLEAAERFGRERARPYVTVNLVNQPLGMIQLRIENIGATAAYHTRIRTSPEIKILRGGQNVHPSTETSEVHPLISNGIAFLPPKLVDESIIAMTYQRYSDEYGSSIFEGIVEYEDKNGLKYEDPLIIDLPSREGLLQRRHFEIGKELHEIRETLNRRLNS